MSLFVVYVPDTGHVVGAVNAIGAALPADPDSPTDPAPLVGAALPLRVSIGPRQIAKLLLPVEHLAVLAADDESEVFANPLAFGVDGQPPKPALVSLPSEPVELAFTPNSIIVTAPVADENERRTVLVLISQGEGAIVRIGDIAVGEDSVELPVTVASGDTRGVLALVAGWTGVLKAVTRS